MIDEKVLKEAFINSVNTGYESFPVDLIIECIDEQKKVGEWIPVSERLPEDSHYYLVTIKGAKKSTELFCDCVTGLWSNDLEQTYSVTAWQELPPAYEGK